MSACSGPEVVHACMHAFGKQAGKQSVQAAIRSRARPCVQIARRPLTFAPLSPLLLCPAASPPAPPPCCSWVLAKMSGSDTSRTVRALGSTSRLYVFLSCGDFRQVPIVCGGVYLDV